MTHYGWLGVAAFGIVLGIVAAAAHAMGAVRRKEDGPDQDIDTPVIG